jgi:hypothetical protein
VLSIGKVGGGNGDPRYYIDTVAQGKEDYYSGRGESPGRWLGSGATAASLNGTVDDEQFLALLSSETVNPRKVLAYDLTFSAPKKLFHNEFRRRQHMIEQARCSIARCWSGSRS